VPFTLVHTVKYRTEDKLNIQTVSKRNYTQAIFNQTSPKIYKSKNKSILNITNG